MEEPTTLFAETHLQRFLMEKAKAFAQEIEHDAALKSTLFPQSDEVPGKYPHIVGGISEERWLQLAVGAAGLVGLFLLGVIIYTFMQY